MTDEDAGTPTAAGGEEPVADVDEIRSERDDLAAEVERLKDRPAKRARWKRRGAVIFVVLTLVATAIAVPGVFARATLLSTDGYVDTVDQLAAQPAIQDAIATEVTAAIFDALDVQTRLAEALRDRAPQLVFLAGPISDAVEGFVQEQVLKVVQSDAFATFWSEANRFLHQQIVSLLEGNDEVVSIQGDTIVFNYLPLLNDALGDLSGVLTDLLGHTVTLPTITQDTVPAEAISKLETALGVDLPETFGTVTLFQGDQLSALQSGFQLANLLAVALVVLIVVFAALALVVSPTKRRTLLQLAVGILVVTVIERRLTIIQVDSIVADVPDDARAAVSAAADVLVGQLLAMTVWVMVAMLIVIAAAVFSGPYAWVASFRAWVGGLARGTATAVGAADASPTAAWVADHREPLMIGVAVLALAIWLFASLSFWGFVVLLLVAGLVELVISRAGPGPEEAS
jgi:hypothetical protein